MKRIAIVGSPGSGKSTLATQLGKKLDIPVYHLDVLFHKPGWEPLGQEEWHSLLKGLVSKDKWIIDGNYQRSMHQRFEAADTIIFLDYSRSLCLWRSIKRRWHYRNSSRTDRAEGCEEKLDLSFLLFILRYPRQKTLENIYTYGKGKEIHIFKSPSETQKFLT